MRPAPHAEGDGDGDGHGAGACTSDGDAFTQAYRAALARRSSTRGPAVQQLLTRRSRLALALAQGLTTATPQPRSAAPPVRPASSPLALLLRELDALAASAGHGHPRGGAEDTAAAAAGPVCSPPQTAPELRPLRHAGPAWAHLRVQHQVRQSLAQAPEQAGPLNSHALALRTLQRLQALSPGYLLRFMQQMEALFALERLRALAPNPAPSGKPPRRGAGVNTRKVGKDSKAGKAGKG